MDVSGIALSHITVYQCIVANKTHGGSLYKDLSRFGKRRCSDGKCKTGCAIMPNRVDITDRPEAVDLRSCLSGWEVFRPNCDHRPDQLTLPWKVRTCKL